MRPNTEKYQTLGNTEILKKYKTAFLCSRKVPAQIILKCFDWAKEQRAKGNCIVCGHHSPIEKDVFEILLRGKQPLILVIARGMKTRWEAEILQALELNRLLIISPFNNEVKRITRETARIRNQKIIDMSNSVCVGYLNPGGLLDELLNGISYQNIISSNH